MYCCDMFSESQANDKYCKHCGILIGVVSERVASLMKLFERSPNYSPPKETPKSPLELKLASWLDELKSRENVLDAYFEFPSYDSIRLTKWIKRRGGEEYSISKVYDYSKFKEDMGHLNAAIYEDRRFHGDVGAKVYR